MESGKDFLSASTNSRKNFENMESKIKSVISECNESNKISRIEVSGEFESHEHVKVDNASLIEVYKLNDLFVYRYLNKSGEPINYRISENILIDDSGRLKADVPCIEYSKGGVGNGALLNGSYSMVSSISFCFNEYGSSPNNYCKFRANSEGHTTEKTSYFKSNLLYSLYEERFGYMASNNRIDDCLQNGDLLKIIEMFDFDNKIGIKSVFDKVEKRTLVKKESNNSRRNFLKQLLLKLLKKNVMMDVWANSNSKGNQR